MQVYLLCLLALFHTIQNKTLPLLAFIYVLVVYIYVLVLTSFSSFFSEIFLEGTRILIPKIWKISRHADNNNTLNKIQNKSFCFYIFRLNVKYFSYVDDFYQCYHSPFSFSCSLSYMEGKKYLCSPAGKFLGSLGVIDHIIFTICGVIRFYNTAFAYSTLNRIKDTQFVDNSAGGFTSQKIFINWPLE